MFVPPRKNPICLRSAAIFSLNFYETTGKPSIEFAAVY